MGQNLSLYNANENVSTEEYKFTEIRLVINMLSVKLMRTNQVVIRKLILLFDLRLF